MFLISVDFYLLLGALMGIVSGALGIGGGIIAVPVLYWIFTLVRLSPEISMHMAVASSLAAIFFTSTVSATTHALRKSVEWKFFFRLALGLILGAAGGPLLGRITDEKILKTFLAVIEILAGLYYLFFPLRKSESPRSPSIKVLFFWGLAIGSLGSALGIGGGLLVVPLLLFYGVDPLKAIGTSALTTVPVSLVGTLLQYFSSRHLSLHYGYGFIYLPAVLSVMATSCLTAPVGVKLAHRLSPNLLTRLFAVILLFFGSMMILR